MSLSSIIYSKRIILLISLWVIFIFLAFSPVLKAQFISGDDDRYLTHNVNVLSLDGSYFRTLLKERVKGLHTPLTSLSFFLEHRLFSLNPFVYHLNNVLLHIVAVILVFFFAKYLGFSLTQTFLGAGLFAFFPSQVETVAWIAKRKDLLCAVFYMAGLFNFYKGKTFLSITFALLSMLASPSAITFPLALIFLDGYRQKKVSIKIVLEKWPFFLMAILIGKFSLSSLRLEDFYQGYLMAVVYAMAASIVICRIDTFLKSQEEMIRILFRIAVGALFIGLIFLTYQQTFFYKDSMSFWRHRVQQTGSALALNNLAGVLREANQEEVVLDESLKLYQQAIKVDPQFIASYSNLAEVYKQKGQYKEAIGWYLKALAVDNKNKESMFRLGISYQEINQSQEAIDTFKRLLKTYPDDEDVYMAVVDAYSKAITRNSQEKSYQEERENVLSAYEELSKRKKYSAADYFNLAFLYEQVGGYEEAIRFYKKSLELNPAYEKSLYNLANRYQEMGDFKTALGFYEHLVRFHPKFTLGYLNMGVIYNSLGDVDHARMLYQKAIDVDPSNAGAYFNLGFLNETSGNFKDALNFYEKALENDPQLGEAYYNMGNVYAAQGQLPEAIASYLKTVAINKNHQNAFVNLSILSFKSRDFQGAIRYLEEAKVLGYTPEEEYLKSLEPYRKK